MNAKDDKTMLIPPYGGTLVDRFVADESFEALLAAEPNAGRLTLTHEEMIHLYNLASGCYSPLTGFMTEAEYARVIGSRRLTGGTAWTVPVLLRARGFEAAQLSAERALVLCDTTGREVALLNVEGVFEIDEEAHCAEVYGTTSVNHPGVQDTFSKTRLCIGGTVRVAAGRLEAFRNLKPPAELRTWLDARSVGSVTAFSTRNICHVGHEHLHELALARTDFLGICVITGAQVRGNFLADVVIDTYEYLIENHYPADRVFLLNLRLPPIYAGPNETFLQATVMQNLGFTHFIVGRDHAGIGDFYGKYASQQIFQELAGLDVEIMAIPEPRLSTKTGKVSTVLSADEDESDYQPINGRDVRRFLLEKRYKELNSILRPELRAFLTRMSEERPDDGNGDVRLKEPRQLFYD